MTFVQQKLGTQDSSCQVTQELLMKGLLPCSCQAALDRWTLLNQKGLIKGFLWWSDKADSRGQDAGPLTGCDPHTCPVELRCDTAHRGHTHTDNSIRKCYFTTHTETAKERQLNTQQIQTKLKCVMIQKDFKLKFISVKGTFKHKTVFKHQDALKHLKHSTFRA